MDEEVGSCCTLVQKEFPSIPDDLFQYVKSVLETSCSDFEDGDEVFEAIGGVLQEIDTSKAEEDIRSLCDRMMGLLRSSTDSQTNGAGNAAGNGHLAKRVLDAPIQLGSIGQDQHKEDVDSIWLSKKAEELKTVDLKKLERASELQQKKLEKKEMSGVTVNNANKYKSSEATASQVINKKDEDPNSNNNTKDIKIESFDISFGEKCLIQGANITLAYGRRYGFVGRNGLGKSTLLRMISSRQLIIPGHLSVLHVEQEVTGDDTLALQSVLESDTHREALLKEERELNKSMAESSSEAQGQRLQAVYAELEAIEADKAPSKASVILAGLGFTAAMQARATKTFSGGWRMRLALARALFCKPDLLLLDEPTNMLDMQAIIWLERYLQTWESTLLVVSHDRSFLDQVPTDILHLHTQRIDTYRGNYTEFVNTMTERHKAQQREYESQMEYRAHIQQFIDKFRFNAKRASLVQSRIKLLERLPELKPVEKEVEVVLKFPEVEKLSPPILMLSEVSFAYTNEQTGVRGPTVFSKVDLSATQESRICIVGENGAGKTTLLKLIMDKNTPTTGQRTAHRNLKFGYFSQHHVDQLDMTVCPVELMAQHFPGHKSEEYRRMLGQFGVSGDLALQQICSLSGGQKSRVAFAILCGHKPNFLVLDEPTNHLDVQTIEALGNAILNYKGGVILVSHDERLIRMVCQELWVCSQGSVYCLEGGFDQYRKIVEKDIVV